MAFPTILFNNSTGSDSAASGAGPSTALSGVDAETVNGSPDVDLSGDAPDLSGVATDGSAVVWVATNSGIQFNKITAVNNTTKIVTCAVNFTNNASTKNWGIGGKRKTIDHANSRNLLTTSIKGGWTVTFEDDTSATISSVITTTLDGSTTDGYITLQGSAEGRVMDQTANASHFNINTVTGYWRFKNLKFTNSNATRTSACFVGSAPVVNWETCIFGDATNKLYRGIVMTNVARLRLTDCEFTTLTNQAIRALNGERIVLEGCYIHDCSDAGIVMAGNLAISDCIIETNGSYGVWFTSNDISYLCNITKSVIHANTSHGIYSDDYFRGTLTIKSNNITANGGYGISMVAAQTGNQSGIDYNNFGTGATANTSGARQNITAGSNDLAVDPSYSSASGANFEAGTSIKALGFPKSTRFIGANQSATNAFVDVGIQREEAGSGGGTTGRQGLHPIESGAV